MFKRQYFFNRGAYRTASNAVVADEVYSDDDFTAVQYTEHEADSVKSLVETDKYWKDFNNNKWSKNRLQL